MVTYLPMFKRLVLIVFMISIAGNAQNIFPYEKEISTKEDYNFQEINFNNTDADIQLSGTLISPKGAFDKIVMIVPGSGKDTRHAHFVLAEELLKNGMAVYRFDERGTGTSEGTYSELAKTLSSDVGFAFKKIQTLYKNKQIGIIAHSLGGIATLETMQEALEPSFVVLIETPVIKHGYSILYQVEQDYEDRVPEMMRKGKTKEEVIDFLKGYVRLISESSTETLQAEVKAYIKAHNFKKKFRVLLDDSFLTEMAKVDCEDVLKDTTVKTLYITGTKDHFINQVEERKLLESFHNPNIEFKTCNGLNHYLTDRNGAVGTSLYNMDKEALHAIITWLQKQ